MINIVLRTNLYKGREVPMSRRDRRRESETNQSSTNSDITLKKQIFWSIVSTIIATIISTFIIFVFSSAFGFFKSSKENIDSVQKLTERLGSIENEGGRLDDIEGSVELLNKEIDKRIKAAKKPINEKLDAIDGRVTNIEELLGNIEKFLIAKGVIPVICEPTSNTRYSISNLGYRIEMGGIATTGCESSKVIATDVETGKKYKAKSLINKPVLMSYKENDQEVYFLGQYNADGHWDGNCTINVYEDDSLVLITDALYSDGKLKKYKQVLQYETAEKSTWIVSNRKCKGKINVGSSWSYYKTDDIVKSFSLKSVGADEILSVKKFKKDLAKVVEGYYCGNSSNGKYNDSTGDAYMIKYNEDGTVRTLYKGCFKNGQFDDSTGKAWYISLDEENSVYVYYKGKFRNGSPLETDNNKRENISNKEIRKIIDKMEFNSAVTLYGESVEEHV